MYQVQSTTGYSFGQYESFEKAKAEVDRFKKITGANYEVVEIKIVYTTSTLDEAMKEV